MEKIKIPHVDMRNTEKQLLVNCNLKICIECGYSHIEQYEFGLSCENCGALLLFNQFKSKNEWRHNKK